MGHDAADRRAHDEVTEAALRAARAVVVLWSPRVAISRWVWMAPSVAIAQRAGTPVGAMSNGADCAVRW